MPDWCKNKLVVKSNGDESSFISFLEQGHKKEIIDGEEKLFWKISHYLPTPKRLLIRATNEKERQELISTYGFDNAYDWRVSFWGIGFEWDDVDYGFTTDEKSIFEILFDSPWDPPIDFLINISIMFPTLSFQLEFIKEGNEVSGIIIIDNGKFLEIFSEMVFKNENNEIIQAEYNEENEQYILSTGEILSKEEWDDDEISIKKNPFEDFTYKIKNNSK